LRVEYLGMAEVLSGKAIYTIIEGLTGLVQAAKKKRKKKKKRERERDIERERREAREK
jgi:hypothetical protein